MLSKQIVNLLFSIIISLLVLFGYSTYLNYTDKLKSEKKISTVISQFKEKFKNDSIYLANENKILIDKISQHIIDSVSIAYEKKLEKIIIDANNKYNHLLLANNIKVKEENLIIPKQTRSHNLNVTTYSKLKKPTNTKQNNKRYNNITTYTKKEANKKTNNNSTITTYSKINQPIKVVSSINNKSDFKRQSNTTQVTKSNLKKNNSTNSNIKHNNYLLDHSNNLHDIDFAPIYKGCKKNKTEEELKNCFAINVSKHIINKFNTLKIEKSGLKKGIHNVRVLFIIDKKGKAKIGKLVGKWPSQIYKNSKFAVESIPQMKPGYSNNKAVSVKYSLLIPFIIK